ncbi:hypothetical protein SAMN04488109_1091 [Chryseolinea serpens]|uniref:Uncharacterized protein n=1 Tax=Chryseolinea serpens TaxID=947013 RepID=A0A1M5L9K5_9BACT|nr:hypothetical protein [Chryseolinea serpens]SHG61605.1 hypothetical protein SAMN04488109_1091 [Chryseolinea serpens]
MQPIVPVFDTVQIDTLRAEPLLEEFYVDSLNVGRKSFNKVEISKYRAIDSMYVIIKFYSKQHSRWKLKNEFRFEKDGIRGCEPQFTDFNNDKLNDITYVANVAARPGSNEMRRLFIYDVRDDKLVSMKNSLDYPNMLYNKKLNCIDALQVYGGCSTVFLKISGDSLRPFAEVELHFGLTVTTYDKKGRAKIIFRDTTKKAAFIRYQTFNPPKPYQDN